jgi:hypothetical protein
MQVVAIDNAGMEQEVDVPGAVEPGLGAVDVISEVDSELEVGDVTGEADMEPAAEDETSDGGSDVIMWTAQPASPTPC